MWSGTAAAATAAAQTPAKAVHLADDARGHQQNASSVKLIATSTDVHDLARTIL